MRLIAERLAAVRGGEQVFRRVDFALEDGGSLVVTGPNGSGKSTLLQVLCGLLPAASGKVRVEGGLADTGVAASCHYLGHDNAMKTSLTVTENLRFWQRFLGSPALGLAEALEAVGLGGIGHLPFAYLSTGQRRRAAIARLLISHRPIWLLDEPTAGLDAASEGIFAGLMNAHLRAGGILVAATHLPLGVEGAQSLSLGAIGNG